MSTMTSTRRAQNEGRRHADSRWFHVLARAGMATRGVLFAIIGGLALALALGAGGKTTDNQGALATVAKAPFGKVVLVVLAIGLLGYALWRLAQTFLDTDDKGEGAGALASRAAKIGSAIAYGSLFVVAVSLITGSGGGGGNSEKSTTAGVLGWPAGQWIVGAVALIIFGVGVWNVYRGISANFMKRLRTNSDAVKTVGRVGHIGRGVVFGLIGVFLMKAAIEYDPKEAVGLDGALARLADRAYGPWLLALVALGLIAFALFCLAEARYREV